MSLLSKGSAHRKNGNGQTNEVWERQEFPIKKGRFKGLDEEEYKAEIRRLRKNKKERDEQNKKKNG